MEITEYFACDVLCSYLLYGETIEKPCKPFTALQINIMCTKNTAYVCDYYTHFPIFK